MPAMLPSMRGTSVNKVSPRITGSLFALDKRGKARLKVCPKWRSRFHFKVSDSKATMPCALCLLWARGSESGWGSLPSNAYDVALGEEE